VAKIRHIAIKVEDQEKTAEFYQKTFGMTEADKKPRDGRFAEMGVHDPTGQLVDVTVPGWKS
jgi:catechol 2,3-dioxygenase-like lactoylglutathione lyase family enzyme